MQRKPIANKYRKGTMKSTLHSTLNYVLRLGVLHIWLTSSKGSERESEIALQALLLMCAIAYHTHACMLYAYYEYFIQRSTIGQSVFALNFFSGSGLLCVHITLYVLLYIFTYKDATIRPVLKHGPRSSTGLRVVEFNTKLIAAKRKQNMCDVDLYYCSTGWLRIYVECSHCAYTNDFFFAEIFIRIIKLKSILVETRKMVNYARTWWSQVKTWWKLALCGTDVQIVAAWPEYRGERLIEPSSSWFPPKFPLG